MAHTSGVMIVDPSSQNSRADFGADIMPNFSEARNYLRKHQPALIVFGKEAQENLDQFCEFALQSAPQSLWILVSKDILDAQILHWTNFGKVHNIIDSLADPTLESKVQSALESAGEIQQRTQLVKLFGEQTQYLQKLSFELEARVEKRHKTLRKSKKTLQTTTTRLESFHRALLGIHRASSILQMEQTLNEALRETIPLAWVRVRFENQSLLPRKNADNILAIDIPFLDETLRGQVLFCNGEGKRFTSSEVDFLHEVSEALALALSRLDKLEQAETIKAQWQATFDSIPHALCLASSDFEILKLNQAFLTACGSQTFLELIGRDCFEVFFGHEFRPPHNMCSPFSFRNSRTGSRKTEHYEVIGETLSMTVEQLPVQLILIRSITDEVRFERRILEASKLAELGTIGSSIAHELNNPLGGMLSFLQLILMDISKTDAIYPEIKEMEKAVLRCRDIVINLLSFARKQDLGEFTPIDLDDVLTRAVKLIELQSKSQGIQIEIQAPDKSPSMVQGSLNALSQALCNLFQNSIDSLGERLKSDALFPAKIKVLITRANGKIQVRVCDNGMGIRPENQTRIFNPLFTTRDPTHYNGMGLTTAFTIINEHHGSLEILSQTGSGTIAIITLTELNARKTAF